jgi:beta-galactosidase
LARYDVIVLACAYMVRAEQAQRIVERTRAGATLVATCFSGVVDEHDRIHDGGPPGPLRDALGVVVEEFDALPPEAKQSVRFEESFGELAAGVEHDTFLLCERVWLRGARALARYTHAFYAGDPAVTVNALGRGKGYYVATCLETVAYGALLRAVCGERGIGSPLKGGVAPPAGVEVTLRTSPDGRTVLYLLNHGDAVQQVPLPEGRHVDLLAKKTLLGATTLSPGEVLVLESGRNI